MLFFGNTGHHTADLAAALGGRALLGLPAAGGSRDGPTIEYALIRQQKTMLGEPDGTPTSRIRRLQRVLDGAGFPTLISADIGGWLPGHDAFVVPIAVGEFGLPGPVAASIGPAAVGADQQPGGARVQDGSDLGPPGGDGVHRERSRVVVGAHRYPPGVGAQVVDPVRVGLAQLGR